MEFTIIDAMKAAGYEGLPGGREAIRRAEEREARTIETCRDHMARVCHHLRVDDSGDVPLKINPPKFDLGHEGVEFWGRMHVVYATIDARGKQTCRIT